MKCAHEWIEIEEIVHVCRKCGDLESDMTMDDLIVLNEYLQHQYISYENLALMEVVRKISRIVEKNELARRNSQSA